MHRMLAALALLATGLINGCSGDNSPAQRPQPNDPRQGGTGASPAPQASAHYLGPFSSILPGVGTVAVDYRGCDGLQIVASGRCLSLRVDGEVRIVDTIEAGSIVEFALDLSAEREAFIDVQHAVVGPVQSIDAAGAKFTALGQTVSITDLTRGFDPSAPGAPADLGDLNIGDYVTVSGYFSAGGQILASRVDRNADPVPPLLRGVLAAAANGGLRIGGMTIDLASASLENFPGGTPLAGDAVLLFADQAPNGDVLGVRSAHYATIAFQPAAESYLRGFVTEVRENRDFDVGGRTVRLHDCEECDALDASGARLREGAFVQLGRIDNGTHYLTPGWTTGDSTGLTGPVEAIDVESGVLTVLAFNVQATPATYISSDGQLSVGSEMLNLGDIAVGTTVYVRGGTIDDVVIADRVVSPVESNSSIVTYRFDLLDPDIVFLGRHIRTDASTPVINCDVFEEVCSTSDTATLFASVDDPPWALAIDVAVTGSELRATRIKAYKGY